MGKGYVLINRRIEDHWLWTDKPFSKGQAWIDLILMANFADSTVIIKGKVVQIKRGQLLRSIDSLAKRWGWSNKKVRDFVKTVRGHQMVTAQGTPQGTLITIENYTYWQTLGQESGHQSGHQKGQAREHVINNVKRNIKNNNNKGFCPPSFNEVLTYVSEHGYEMDAEAFFDYYQETGWIKKNGQPIKDWKATVRSWERRSKEWQAKGDAIHAPNYKPYKPEEYKREPMPEEMREQIRKKGGKV